MNLDVARFNGIHVSQSISKPGKGDLGRLTSTPPQRPHQIIHLDALRRAPYCVRDADPVHADLVDGAVQRQEVDHFGVERVLGREAHLEPLGLDKSDDLKRGRRDGPPYPCRGRTRGESGTCR
jgi:hypothetical protein